MRAKLKNPLNSIDEFIETMPYVQRNDAGNIIALTAVASDSANEFVAVDHPEVLKFLAIGADRRGASSSNIDLLASDLKLMRGLEDLIDLLISKNVLMFSELPLAVQEKLLQKKGLRDKLFGHADIIVPDEPLL